MVCPVCGNDMIEQDFGGVMVDVCKNGCKGIWFDWFELMKLDESNEGLGNALKNALNEPRINDENREHIKCPKCSIPMHIHKYQSSKEVNVDECYGCGGFFLDSGELSAIRESFMTEEEQEKYADKLTDEIPEYSEGVDDIEKKKTRIKAIKSFTKFIRASYYLTGK